MSVKFPAGLPVVIHSVPEAAAENAARSRAGGQTFVPAWRVWTYGPTKKLPKGAMQVWNLHNDPGKSVAVYGAFTFEGEGLRPATTFDKFPHSWAPRALQSVTAWLETDNGLTATINQTEEVNTNG